MVQIKSRAPETISSQNNPKGIQKTQHSLGTTGFTLIEILLVLSIIVLVLSYGMPVVSRITGQNIATSARKFTALVRGMRTDAILLNSIYRLTLDLENNTYLVESQKDSDLISESSLLSKKVDPQKKDEPEAPSSFSPAEKYFAKPKPLPGGVVFSGVLKEKEGLVKEGTAYIYFFPNGLNEKAIIILNTEKVQEGGYSLYIHPTAGKVDFFKQRVDQF